MEVAVAQDQGGPGGGHDPAEPFGPVGRHADLGAVGPPQPGQLLAQRLGEPVLVDAGVARPPPPGPPGDERHPGHRRRHRGPVQRGPVQRGHEPAEGGPLPVAQPLLHRRPALHPRVQQQGEAGQRPPRLAVHRGDGGHDLLQPLLAQEHRYPDRPRVGGSPPDLAEPAAAVGGDDAEGPGPGIVPDREELHRGDRHPPPVGQGGRQGAVGERRPLPHLTGSATGPRSAGRPRRPRGGR